MTTRANSCFLQKNPLMFTSIGSALSSYIWGSSEAKQEDYEQALASITGSLFKVVGNSPQCL